MNNWEYVKCGHSCIVAKTIDDKIWMLEMKEANMFKAEYGREIVPVPVKTGSQLPVITDQNVNAYVFKKAINNPVVIYPVVVGGLMLQLGFPVVSIPLLIIGVGVFIKNNFFKKQEVINEFYENYRNQKLLETQEKRNNIIRYLNANGRKDAGSKISQLINSIEELKEVINQKFSDTEIAHEKYNSMADDILNSAIESMERVIVLTDLMNKMKEKLIYNPSDIKSVDVYDNANKEISEILVTVDDALTQSRNTFAVITKLNEFSGKQLQKSILALEDFNKFAKDHLS